MTEWEKQIGAINLIVGDLERSAAFYQQVFGLPLQHEDEDTAMFRFKDTYVFLQRGSAHRNDPSDEAFKLAQNGVGQFAIIVADVDAVRAELDQHGVTLISGPADRARLLDRPTGSRNPAQSLRRSNGSSERRPSGSAGERFAHVPGRW
jgi:catechol 2,3-dioxygenase-like lactoylglutathione lyase family enzyme